MPMHTEGRKTMQGRKTQKRKSSSYSNSSNSNEFMGVVVGLRGAQQNQFNIMVRGKTRKYKIGRGVDGRPALTAAEISEGATVILRKDPSTHKGKKMHPKIVGIVGQNQWGP